MGKRSGRAAMAVKQTDCHLCRAVRHGGEENVLETAPHPGGLFRILPLLTQGAEGIAVKDGTVLCPDDYLSVASKQEAVKMIAPSGPSVQGSNFVQGYGSLCGGAGECVVKTESALLSVQGENRNGGQQNKDGFLYGAKIIILFVIYADFG